ncbi:hypothetical protein N7449_000439 [Penicillium cf. viridicatum]|uniref:Uncharacterized protein n=1 Tax=Penicillium cf. viridicatum TaxID=2972119 RepID=A0A9W9N514_9EURO|nr:hypothetical protein N7449_000439 [Penicillium cf. viridicatum]
MSPSVSSILIYPHLSSLQVINIYLVGDTMASRDDPTSQAPPPDTPRQRLKVDLDTPISEPLSCYGESHVRFPKTLGQHYDLDSAKLDSLSFGEFIRLTELVDPGLPNPRGWYAERDKPPNESSDETPSGAGVMQKVKKRSDKLKGVSVNTPLEALNN